jgi:hypothetical protein
MVPFQAKTAELVWAAAVEVDHLEFKVITPLIVPEEVAAALVYTAKVSA